MTSRRVTTAGRTAGSTRSSRCAVVAYAAGALRHGGAGDRIARPSRAAIAAYPELGNTPEAWPVGTKWGVEPHILNAEESTIRFYQDVLDEILDIFHRHSSTSAATKR